MFKSNLAKSNSYQPPKCWVNRHDQFLMSNANYSKLVRTSKCLVPWIYSQESYHNQRNSEFVRVVLKKKSQGKCFKVSLKSEDLMASKLTVESKIHRG